MPEAAADAPGDAREPDAPLSRVLIPSPLGALGIELTGETLTGVVIVPKGRARKLYKPFAKLKPAERSEFLDEVLGRFSEFLAGARRSFDLGYDLKASGVDAFARRALRQVAKIPYGRTRTYGEVAAALGRPDGYRQVLSSLLINPLPIVVPCHRVVTGKSGIGSYIGGSKKKAWLLRLEQRSSISE